MVKDMSKYAPLTAFLRSRPQRELHCTFKELERELGFPLPPVARAHRAWWSNNASNNVMTKAWLKAGFRAEQVDMAGETLVFRRIDETRPSPTSAKPLEPPLDDAALIGRILDVLRGDEREAQEFRRAIIAALPGAKPKSTLDVFGSDLPDETFEGVFTEERDSGWRGVDL
jgi:hypothetical protein